MGKKIVLFALLLLPATFTFAQISMNGQLQQLFGHDIIADGLIECNGQVIYNGIYLPTYKPKTKSVTIKKRELTYDGYEEKWRNANDPIYYYEGYKVVYDSLGRIINIFFHYDDCHRCLEKGEWSWGYRFEYEDGRLVEIKVKSFIGSDTSYRGAIKVKYNANGVVSKILIRDSGPDEVRVKWNPQGFLSQIQKYKNGEPYGSSLWPSTVSYQVSQNGKSIIEISGSKRNQITKDEHGAAKRYKDEYYENKYDEDGNLIQQIKYRIIGGEKVYESRGGLYKGGCSFEYEYEFYE